MILKLIYFALLLTITVKAQPKYLSEDELNKLYFYQGRYDRKLWHAPSKYTHKSEFINYCGNPNSFMDKLAFGLVFQNHDFMTKLTTDLAKSVFNDFDQLDEYFIQRVIDYNSIKPKSFYEHDPIWATKLEEEYNNKTIEIKRNIDYLRNTLLDLYSINTNHGTAAVVAADIYLGRYERAAQNMEELIVGTLILDIVNKTLLAEIGTTDATIGLLHTVDIIIKKEENMDLVSTILVSMFTVLLENDRTFSEEMLILAEKVKVAIRKFTATGTNDHRYNVMRNKFKFILMHIPEVIRHFVWDVPRKQDNFYCVKNHRYQKYMYCKEDLHGNPVLVTGGKCNEKLEQERFSIKFNQQYMHYEIDSPYYRTLLAKRRIPLPYRRFFLIPSKEAFYIKAFKNDDENDMVFLRAVESNEVKSIQFHRSNSFEDMFSEFAGAVLWVITVCVS